MSSPKSRSRQAEARAGLGTPAPRPDAGSRPAAAPRVDRAELADGLRAGATELGLDLPDATLARLLDYLALLVKWNAVYNLTAVRDPRSMLIQHLLDSLAIVPPLAERGPFRCVVDVGSGGGLPGIVLAIVWPETAVHLVEPVGKKAAFLRQCVSELALAHVEIHAQRVEALPTDGTIAPDLIVCRAFASLRDFVSGIGGLVGPNTIVAAMKGLLPQDEIDALPPAWGVARILPLVVPRLDAQRHLLLLQRSGAAEAATPATPAR